MQKQSTCQNCTNFLNEWAIATECIMLYYCYIVYHSEKLVNIWSRYSRGSDQIITFFSQLSTFNYSICKKKRFEKGLLAEIYSLCASERLLIYLHPIFSQLKFKLEKMIGIQKHTGQFRKNIDFFFLQIFYYSFRLKCKRPP